MAQLFGPRANSVGRLVLIALVAVPLGAGLLYLVLMDSPYVTGEGYTPLQPVPFSHKHHVMEEGIDCRYCHFTVETSAVAGVPPTRVCMSCHSQLWNDAEMLAPVRASFRDSSPLRWQQVNRLPDYVYFDHSIHVAKGVGCTSCHGDVAGMPLTRQAAKLTMGFCLACHRDPGPSLRRTGEVFAARTPPPNDRAEAERLLDHWHIDHTDHLTDCSTCHR